MNASTSSSAPAFIFSDFMNIPKRNDHRGVCLIPGWSRPQEAVPHVRGVARSNACSSNGVALLQRTLPLDEPLWTHQFIRIARRQEHIDGQKLKPHRVGTDYEPSSCAASSALKSDDEGYPFTGARTALVQDVSVNQSETGCRGKWGRSGVENSRGRRSAATHNSAFFFPLVPPCLGRRASTL